jgi:hypothetical protein
MNPATIRDQINRILRSQSFANKSQLRKLLEVLYNNMDSQAALKPDQVIKELWPGETRTKRAADVATEMSRLRHALESYYNEEGMADRIVISLPNRSASAGDGRSEKRWIMAVPRGEADDQALGDQTPGVHPVVSQRKARRGLKLLVPVIALGSTLAIVAYISSRMLAKPEQPRLGRMEGSRLIVTNAEGKELWSEKFPGGFGPDSYYGQGLASRLWFADLEGRGHTSVLFSYLPPRAHNPIRRRLSATPTEARRNGAGLPGDSCQNSMGQRRSRPSLSEY